MKQALVFAANLAADDDIRSCVDTPLDQRLPIEALHFAQGITRVPGHLEHRIGVPDRGGIVRRKFLPVENVGHTLRQGKVSARQQDNDAVIGFFVDAHFAKRGDLVHACVGA